MNLITSYMNANLEYIAFNISDQMHTSFYDEGTRKVLRPRESIIISSGVAQMIESMLFDNDCIRIITRPKVRGVAS